MSQGRFIELKIGDKFNRWTVINNEIQRLRIGKQESLRCFVLCKCECGSEKYVRKDYLGTGQSKSCGCLKADLARIKGKNQRSHSSYINWMYDQKKRQTIRHRNLNFDIDKDKFLEIITQACYYCGAEPKINESKTHEVVGIRIAHNTIDRIDSTIGYTSDNCVAACLTCNIMKMDMDVSKFIDHIQQISEFQKNKG